MVLSLGYCAKVSRLAESGMTLFLAYALSVGIPVIGSRVSSAQAPNDEISHSSAVVDLAVSHDGSALVSMSQRGAIVVTDMRDERAPHSTTLKKSDALACGFHESGTLYVCTRRRTSDVTAFNVDVVAYEQVNGRWREANRLYLPHIACGPVALSPDCESVAMITGPTSCTSRRELAIYDIKSAHPTTSIMLDRRCAPTALALDRSAAHVVVGFSDGQCAVIAVGHGSGAEYYSGCRNEVTNVTISDDGNWIAATTGSEVILWNTRSHNIRVIADSYRNMRPNRLPDLVTSVKLLSDDASGCYATKSGRIAFFDRFGRITSTYRDPAGVSAIAISDEKTMVIGTPVGGVFVKGRANRKRLCVLGPLYGQPNDIALAFAARRRVAVACSGNATILWDLDSDETSVLYGTLDRVLCTTFSRDGRRVWTSHGLAHSQELRLWDANSGKLLDRFILPLDPLVYGNSMTVNNGGETLLLGNSLFTFCRTVRRKWTFGDSDTQIAPLIEFSALLPHGNETVFCGQRGLAHSRVFVARCEVATGRVVSETEVALSTNGRTQRRVWALHDNGNVLLGIAGEEWFLLNLTENRVFKRGNCPAFEAGVVCALFARDHRQNTTSVVCGLRNGRIIMVDLRDGNVSDTVITGNSTVRCIEIPSGGQDVVFGTAGGRVGAWNTRQREIQWMPTLDAAAHSPKKKINPNEKVGGQSDGPGQ